MRIVYTVISIFVVIRSVSFAIYLLKIKNIAAFIYTVVLVILVCLSNLVYIISTII